MGDVLEFKRSKKSKEEKNKKLCNQRLNHLYWITSGFEFPGQDPEIRQLFEDGEIEL